MAIYVDPVRTHDSDNTGNDTVPPGISGLDWCHCISDTSLIELEAFLTTNILTIGQLATNVRTPLLGSNITYVGFDATMRAAAVAAGAIEQGKPYVLSHSFDAGANTWEP